MPRYFFDVQDGFDHRDEIGREVTDYQALRHEALRVITTLMDKETEGSDGFTIIVNVRDATGAIVLTLRSVCQFDESAVRSLRAAS